MTDKPQIEFATPEFSYDELEQQVQAYTPDPRYPHDEAAIICIEEGIRSGRLGNVAVGGCMYKHDELILRDITKANSPFHRTDLHAEMVLLNQLEEQLCDDKTPNMRDYTFGTNTVDWMFW